MREDHPSYQKAIDDSRERETNRSTVGKIHAGVVWMTKVLTRCRKTETSLLVRAVVVEIERCRKSGCHRVVAVVIGLPRMSDCHPFILSFL